MKTSFFVQCGFDKTFKGFLAISGDKYMFRFDKPHKRWNKRENITFKNFCRINLYVWSKYKTNMLTEQKHLETFPE